MPAGMVSAELAEAIGLEVKTFTANGAETGAGFSPPALMLEEDNLNPDSDLLNPDSLNRLSNRYTRITVKMSRTDSNIFVRRRPEFVANTSSMA